MYDRVAIAKRWIEKGYNPNKVLNSVGLAASTYYHNISSNTRKACQKTKNRVGRKIPGYYEKVSDEQVKEYLSELIAGDGFPYGRRKPLKNPLHSLNKRSIKQSVVSFI